MSALWLWVRTDAQRRRRPAVVLALLVALAGGVILAAVAGGRRNGTAVERATALTSPSDGLALVNQPGFDWDRVRRLPEVRAVAEFPVTFYEIEGHPDLEPGFPPASPEGMTELEVPIVVAGRLPRQDRVDEVTIAPQAHAKGIDIGDRLTVSMLSAEDLAAVINGRQPAGRPGARQSVTVVGIAKDAFFGNEVQNTLAFYERYRHDLTPARYGYVNALVKLRRGPVDLPRLQADLNRLAGHDVELRDGRTEIKRSANATHLERDALYGFAAAAAAAALVLVGQAVVRMVTASRHEVPQMAALGVTRRTAVAALAALPAAACVAGSLAAGVVAYLLSERFPIGVGREHEPHPGRLVDWVVVAPGVAGLLAVSVVGTWVVARLAVPRGLPAGSGAGRAPASAAAGDGSRLVRRVAAADTPVPFALGVRLALDRGDGRAAVPVRPALVGAVVGVLGVVAALTFGAGLGRATDDAALFGQTFDAGVIGVGKSALSGDQQQALARDPAVEMAADVRNVILRIDGHDVSLFGVRRLSGRWDERAVQGRLPSAPDEIALAPTDMRALGVEVGDRVRLDDHDAMLTVVGEAFSPEISHTAYDQGGQMTDDGLRRFVSGDAPVKFDTFAVRFRPGTDQGAAIERLNQGAAHGLLEPRTPVFDQQNLRGVRSLPLLLGAFLALLAVGAVGHALASTVRRRRHDLAVLRVLGLTRRQARATVAWQATTLAAVGLAFGLPVGVAVGRTLWQVVAERTPMLYVPPLAVVALLVVPPAAVVVTNAIAAWPGHVAARVRPAESLRTE